MWSPFDMLVPSSPTSPASGGWRRELSVDVGEAECRPSITSPSASDPPSCWMTPKANNVREDWPTSSTTPKHCEEA
eukprot:CAMPEP_0174369102 /NCGR_PEP_ID=MMETSP0811_2-20130205/91333_1 /TAXON_ID=73025 ORGANISM="Eutreptiella gymnastica-like, Strain CCMP1594" /NCGR_SAMPLE_ID=MMETSP0811_2 /ASSEMBLY_ACC=CAM_ASM_000667 /LENGTH=75 /DNA_ID=CAMNT_0015513209 /DNA_START=28 /DNA_END=251 /DNA_ORIENTATION=+